MAQQTINVGAAPNDGTGTPLRTAFQYTNSNFSELYTAVGPSGNNIVVPGNATITGDLTVDTDVLKVDTSLNRVGIGTASPAATAEVNGGNLYINGNAGAYGLYSFYDRTNYANIFSLIRHNGDSGGTQIYNINSSTDRSFNFYSGTTLAGASLLMTLNSTGLGVGGSPVNPITAYAAASAKAPALLLTTVGSPTYGWDFSVDGAVNGNLFIRSLVAGTKTDVLEFDRSNGNVGVGVTPSSGRGAIQLSAGVGFPATQVASSDANTLDDYEEGTFTATLKGGTADPTTPVTTTGRYTKIGRLVSIQLYFNNVNTTGASGSISVSGLPFSSASSIYNSGSAVSGDMATFTGTLGCWLPPSSSTIDVISSASNGSISSATHNAGASRYLAINIEYAV